MGRSSYHHPWPQHHRTGGARSACVRSTRIHGHHRMCLCSLRKSRCRPSLEGPIAQLADAVHPPTEHAHSMVRHRHAICLRRAPPHPRDGGRGGSPTEGCDRAGPVTQLPLLIPPQHITVPLATNAQEKSRPSPRYAFRGHLNGDRCPRWLVDHRRADRGRSHPNIGDFILEEDA